MATGDSNDILSRVKKLIPYGWFSSTAPIRDAVLGGMSDVTSSFYNLLVYAQQQARIATAGGPFLDIIAYDYLGRFLQRNGESDEVFRNQILSTVLQERVTRAGMTGVMGKLTGNTPTIFEPWNPYDTGCYQPGSAIKYTFSTSTLGGSTTVYTPTQLVSTINKAEASVLSTSGQFGYGVGRGGWGNMKLPGQVFIKQQRGSYSGIPNVAGYSSKVKNVTIGAGGYGVGNIAYGGPGLVPIGVTDQVIQLTIVNAKPSGVTAWLQIT